MGKQATVIVEGKKYTVKKIIDFYGMVLYVLLKRYRGNRAHEVCTDVMVECVRKAEYKHWEDFKNYLCDFAYTRLCKKRKTIKLGETNNTEKAISAVATLRNSLSKYSQIPGLVPYITEHEIGPFATEYEAALYFTQDEIESNSAQSVKDAYKEMDREDMALLKAITRAYHRIGKYELKQLQSMLYKRTMQKYGENVGIYNNL